MYIRDSLRKADKRVSIAILILLIFGSLMIVSAEMGNNVGNTSYLSLVIRHQLMYVVAGAIVYFAFLFNDFLKFRLSLYYFGYAFILVALLACRLFGQVGGAYAWLWIGNAISIQPSEFAKLFMIALAAKMFATDKQEKNIINFRNYAIMAAVYILIILGYQHDLGSAVVLAIICYCVMLVPNYKEIRKYQNYMLIGVVAAIALALLILSDPVTEFLKVHSDNYMIGRFLAAADPFLYQYDNGYHIIMSLVSFANGGLFGLGYGNSIHKYMNFPNPSNDFILPVIVEELGIVGFVGFILVYGLMLYPIVSASLKTKVLQTKIVLLGVFIYFCVHFILNVGGVSGLIPLTGVPILMISSGGSSLMACLGALGMAQRQLIKHKDSLDENNSR